MRISTRVPSLFQVITSARKPSRPRIHVYSRCDPMYPPGVCGNTERTPSGLPMASGIARRLNASRPPGQNGHAKRDLRQPAFDVAVSHHRTEEHYGNGRHAFNYRGTALGRSGMTVSSPDRRTFLAAGISAAVGLALRPAAGQSQDLASLTLGQVSVLLRSRSVSSVALTCSARRRACHFQPLVSVPVSFRRRRAPVSLNI
jgi:hypothetical protein